MEMQQSGHVINKGVCVCARERGSAVVRGMSEDEEEEEEEGFCEWLQAATQVRDFFFSRS